MSSLPTTNASLAGRKAESSADTVRNETVLAIRNALMLAVSLVATLGVAVAIRIWIPRFLGPAIFGRLQFAEDFATAALYFTTLGVDTYIKREIAIRPQHASDFFGGLVQARLVATLLVSLAMSAVLLLMGKPSTEWPLVYLYAVGQTAFVFNTSVISCLQAVGRVRELAVANVLSKIVWGAAIVIGLSAGGSLIVVPIAFLATESLKSPFLYWAARRHLDLRMRLQLRPMITVLAFSAPYYLNELSHEVYARLGVTVMSSMTHDAEVGWFGAANQVKTLVLLALPIINAVVLPMTSRVARESVESLNELMRGATRLSFAVAVPLALVLALNASTVIGILFSSEYAPAHRSLVVLAALIPLASYCVLAGMHLLQLGKIWTVTFISLVGLAVGIVANPMLIGACQNELGRGGAGVGAALVALLIETIVAFLMARALGEAGRDRRRRGLFAKLAIAAVIIAGLHVLAAPLGGWRLLLDVTVTFTAVTALKILPLQEIRTYARLVLQRRS